MDNLDNADKKPEKASDRGADQGSERGSDKGRRWVLKVGTSMVTNEGRGLDEVRITHWAEQIAELRRRGFEVLLVSSGAIAAGMQRLAWTQRPTAIHQLQAAAAVGQVGLARVYEACFEGYQIPTAQILLTHEDFADRSRYLNARATLLELLRLKVVPIINENDTVATDEIRFGDNDTLSALVANLVGAERLVILTDQEGLYEADPRKNPEAKLVSEGTAGDPKLEEMAGGAGSSLGRGGMLTKLTAAGRAAMSGTHTVSASGRIPQILSRLAKGESMGTFLRASTPPLAARKAWLANQLHTSGCLVLDSIACVAVSQKNKSLLPAGVLEVKGEFGRGDTVSLQDQTGRDLARGLVNYNAGEARLIIQKPSSLIASILGYANEPELVHKDNLCLLPGVGMLESVD